MKISERINLTIRGYKTINKLLPGFLIASFVQAIASALLPYINIFMSARIITAIADGRELRNVMTLAVITIVLNLIIDLILKAISRIISYNWAKFWIVCDEPIYEKIRSMDYEYIEDVNTHLKRQKINTHIETNGFGFLTLMDRFGGILRHTFSIIFGFSLAISAFTTCSEVDAGFWNFLFEPWFVLIIIACFVINIAVEMYSTAARAKKNNALNPEFHQIGHIWNVYSDYFLNYKAGKDLKIYGLGKLISVEFMDYYVNFYKVIMKKYHRISIKYDGLSQVNNAALNIIIYGYVAIKSLFGSFGVGNIVQYVGSLRQFMMGIRGFMNNLTTLMANAEAMKDYYDFIDIPSKMHQGILPVEKSEDNKYEIEFKNVSFKYPGSENYVLKNFNLKFNTGQHMAVVGMNGSGKTTMIKLLCRLYDPTEGEITLNGINIKKYEYNEYMSIFSVVFQDFKLFSFSLGQNVAASSAYDVEKTSQCLNMTGFGDRVGNMQKGLKTSLYKDFEEDGVEISGGEAQKIALARALYKDAPFIVLDEPTSALDPIAEFEIYSKFNETVGNKTVIYISHRLSSCRFCDDIAVFHEGKLIQRGNHDTLITHDDGKYHELWNAQAQYYAKNYKDTSYQSNKSFYNKINIDDCETGINC